MPPYIKTPCTLKGEQELSVSFRKSLENSIAALRYARRPLYNFRAYVPMSIFYNIYIRKHDYPFLHHIIKNWYHLAYIFLGVHNGDKYWKLPMRRQSFLLVISLVRTIPGNCLIHCRSCDVVHNEPFHKRLIKGLALPLIVFAYDNPEHLCLAFEFHLFFPLFLFFGDVSTAFNDIGVRHIHEAFLHDMIDIWKNLVDHLLRIHNFYLDRHACRKFEHLGGVKDSVAAVTGHSPEDTYTNDLLLEEYAEEHFIDWFAVELVCLININREFLCRTFVYHALSPI